MKTTAFAHGFAAKIRNIPSSRENALRSAQTIRNTPAHVRERVAALGPHRRSRFLAMLRQQIAVATLTAVVLTRMNLVDASGGAHSAGEPSVAELVGRLSEQSSNLLRNELRLAQTELTGKMKRAGLGFGYLGGAGVLGFLGAAAAVASVILLLARVVPAWLSALMVSIVLSTAAGAAALKGKKEVAEAGPLVPERTVESLKNDVDAVKEHGQP